MSIERRYSIGRNPRTVCGGHLGVLLLVGVTVGLFTSGVYGDHDRRESSRTIVPVHWMVPPWWMSVGDNFPPPPALQPYLPRFVRHYTTYSTLPPDEKPTFSQWLIVNGVIDPTAHRAMMMLYAWAERIG